MPIKKPDILSRADFDEAVVHLRLNVSEVAKATGIPRTYLSEFRNGDRKLRAEQQAKLRDFFEEKGVQFDDDAPEPDSDELTSPHPKVKVVTARRCYFPISDTLPDPAIATAIDAMEQNAARITALCQQKAAWDEPGFSLFEPDEPKLTEDSQAALDEASGLLAANYAIFRVLQGTRLLGSKPAADAPQTIGDIIAQRLRDSLTAAGVLQSDSGEKKTGAGAASDANTEPETEDAAT